MNRKNRTLRALALAAIVALPAPALAQNQPWLAGGVGFHTYGMSDLSDNIAELNAANAPFSLDEIHSGFGFGGMVGVDMPTVSLALGYERLTGSSSVNDDTGSIEYKVPANLYMAQAVYRPASLGGGLKLGLGVGAGLVSSAAEINTTTTGFGTDTQKLDGKGGAFAAFATADFDLGPHFALTPSVGYRYAKIGEVKSDGVVQTNLDGSKFTLDYSGLMAKLMLKVEL
jgi:hypothetical protein